MPWIICTARFPSSAQMLVLECERLAIVCGKSVDLRVRAQVSHRLCVAASAARRRDASGCPPCRTPVDGLELNPGFARSRSATHRWSNRGLGQRFPPTRRRCWSPRISSPDRQWLIGMLDCRPKPVMKGGCETHPDPGVARRDPVRGSHDRANTVHEHSRQARRPKLFSRPHG